MINPLLDFSNLVNTVSSCDFNTIGFSLCGDVQRFNDLRKFYNFTDADCTGLSVEISNNSFFLLLYFINKSDFGGFIEFFEESINWNSIVKRRRANRNLAENTF